MVTQRTSRHLLAALLAGGAALSLGACGASVVEPDQQQSFAEDFATGAQIDAKPKCGDEDVDAKVGKTFTCTYTNTQGKSADITFKITKTTEDTFEGAPADVAKATEAITQLAGGGVKGRSGTSAG